MKKLLICCFCLLLCSETLAVEMSRQQFDNIRANIMSLYQGQEPESLPNMLVVRHDGYIELSTSVESQGAMWLKMPLKKTQVVILQVPHRFHDLHTFEIAQTWFNSAAVDVLMFNHQHRYEDENSDLARISRSLFTAVVSAHLAMEDEVQIIQLHGYSGSKRESISAQQADFILSNGTKVPSNDLVTMQACIRDNSGLLARVYGRDVFELGATLNPVGQLINQHPQISASFLHVEMPLHVRLAFINKQIAEGVISCFIAQ